MKTSTNLPELPASSLTVQRSKRKSLSAPFKQLLSEFQATMCQEHQHKDSRVCVHHLLHTLQTYMHHEISKSMHIMQRILNYSRKKICSQTITTLYSYNPNPWFITRIDEYISDSLKMYIMF